MLRKVKYGTILNWIRSNQTSCNAPFIIHTKRGHQASAWIFGGCILMKSDPNYGHGECVITREKWDKAMNRMDELDGDKKEQNKYYVRPEWDVAENNFGPSCMLICREYWISKDA